MLKIDSPPTGLRRCLILTLLAPIAAIPYTAMGSTSPSFTLTEADLASSKSDWQVLAAGCGSPWLAYYDNSGQGQLRDPEGQRQPLLNVNSKASTKSSGLEMVSLNNGVAILWRDKFPEKQLHLKRSDRPEAEAINLAGDSQPLPRLTALRHGDQLETVWLGEKPQVEGQAPYYIYHRSLNLADGTLSPLEKVMPGLYPMTAMDNAGNLLVASWFDNGENSRIVARYRPTTSQNFGPPVVVTEAFNVTSLNHAFTNRGRWFLLWLRTEGGSAEGMRLEGASSDDAGTTWQTFALEGLAGIDVSSLDMVKNDKGVILIAVSGRYRQQPDTDKHKVFLIRSEDNGSTWSMAPALQSPEAWNQFNAKYPKVTFGAQPGEVLVVWQDWREIRSRLYANFSTDNGKTWAISNLPLPHKSKVNLMLNDSGHDLWLDDCGTFHLVSEQADTDKLNPISLIEQRFTTQDLWDWSKTPQLAPGVIQPQPEAISSPEAASTTIDAVRQRVTEFWTAMIANEFPKTYEFYDPFYRSYVDSRQYELHLGKVKYDNFEIGEIQVEGPVANVEVKVTASVPDFRVPSTGEIVGRPARQITLKDKWLWVDDGWYREFYLSSVEGRWTKY